MSSFVESKEEFLEKGKKAQIGEIREWKGQKFQKQSNGGWIPVKQGTKSSKTEEGGMTKNMSLEDVSDLPKGTVISYEDGLSGAIIDIEKVGENAWKDQDGNTWKDEEVHKSVSHPDVDGVKIEKPTPGKVDKETSIEKKSDKDASEAGKEEKRDSSEKVAGVKDWIGDEASDQEISDVLDAVADFVSPSMLKLQANSPLQFGEKVWDRADEIIEKYREHFDHWDGTDSMPDKQLRKILVAIMYDKRNPRA